MNKNHLRSIAGIVFVGMIIFVGLLSSRSSALSGDVILLWDTANGSVPAGWNCISCDTDTIPGNADDVLKGVFPRGAATYGAATGGGPESHTHTYTSSGVTAPSTLSGLVTTTLSQTPTASFSHTHSFPSPTIGSNDLKPPFQNLLFIKKNNPTSLPQHAIGMFDVASTASLPAGWTSYLPLNDPASTGVSGNGVYLRGEATVGTGGAANHSHTRSGVTSGAAVGSFSPTSGSTAPTTPDTQTHTLTAGSSPTDTNDPSFVTLVFAKVSTASAPLPDGLIAMFDNTSMSLGWQQLSTISGNALAGRLMKGDIAAGITGGRTTHSHSASQTITSSGPSVTNAVLASLVGTSRVASDTHTHDVTYTIGATNSMPVYRDMVLARYTTVTVSGTVYSGEGSGLLAGRSVKVVSAGSGVATTTTGAGGTYSVTVPSPGVGGNITAWLDSGSETGATITRSNNANIVGFDIYQNRLIVRHEDGGPLTNADIGICDKDSGTTCTDPDLHFTESASALTVDSDWGLYLWAGKGFTPGGIITLNTQASATVPGGDLKFGSSASTLTMAANSLSVGGDWYNAVGGTFTRAATQNTTFTSGGSGYVVDHPSSQGFSRLTFNNASGTWSFSQVNQTVSENFVITSGVVTAPSGSLSIGGNLTNTGTFTHNSGTVILTATTAGKTISLGSSQLRNLTLNGSGGVWSATGSPLTIAGDLIVTAGTLDNSGGSVDITVNGSVGGTAGVLSFTNNTFTQRVSSARTFGASSGSTGWTFNNLEFSNASASPVTVTTDTSGTGGIVVNGTLKVSRTGDTSPTTLNAGNRNWTLANANHARPFDMTAASGQLVAATSTFVYAGVNASGNVTIQNATYNNLTLGGASTESYTTEAVLLLNGSLSVNANGSFVGTHDVQVAGAVTGVGTINRAGGSFTQRVSSAQTFGTTSGANDWTFSQLRFENSGGSPSIITAGAGTGKIITSSTLTVGNATDSQLTTFDAGASNRVLDVNADVNITSKGSLKAPTSAAFTVAGSWSNGGVFTANAGTVTFDAGTAGHTIAPGGTGTSKDFYKVIINNSSGGWTVAGSHMTTQSDLTLSALSSFTLEASRTLEVKGIYASCVICPAGTTWTGSTLFLNSGTAYTVGSKTQSAETYGTLQVGVNTDVRLWNSSATTATIVDVTGSLYSQDHGVTDGLLNIYGDYHVTGSDYWQYEVDFDGAALAGAAKRQAVVRIETGAGRGVVVDATKTLTVVGGGTGANQFTDITRSGTSGTYTLVNSGTVDMHETKVANAVFAGGTWAPYNTVITTPSVTAGTLTVDWYLGLHVVDRDATGTNIDTAAADVTVSEVDSSATVFSYSGGWGSPASSKSADTNASGRIVQPNATNALRIREFSKTSASTTYYRYNLAVNKQASYTDYNYFRDHGNTYLTSIDSPLGSGVNKSISSSWYRDVIGSENADPGSPNASTPAGTWYVGMARAIIVLWDGAVIPTGWTCVSCVPGDPFYQKFVRATATYGGTGGSDTHGHNLAFTGATAGSVQTATGVVNAASGAHTHTWGYTGSPNTTVVDIKPAYQQLKFIRGPVTGTWPAGIIMPYASTTVPTNWAQYSSQNAKYLRGGDTVVSAGAATHTHNANALTSGGSVGTAGTACTVSCTTVANPGHVHTLSSTALTADSNDPPFVDTVFMKSTAVTSPGADALGFFDYTSPVPTSWSLVSGTSPYLNNFIKGATTFGGTGGTSVRNHGGSLTRTSSLADLRNINRIAGTANVADQGHTHDATHTVDNQSTMPAYVDAVVMKYSGSLNQNPDIPASTTQKRVSDGSTIATGSWTSQTTVRFEAAVSDPDVGDTVRLCVEAKPVGSAFTSPAGDGDGCSTSGVASGSTATVTLTGLSDATAYHWQVRTKDALGAYSTWTPYGGNNDTPTAATDFGIDTTPPVVGTVYDNLNTDSQPLTTDSSENGDGSLTTLSASWGGVNAAVSGVSKYEYSIGTSVGGTDVRAWSDSGNGGTDTFVRVGGLTLQTNKMYYINVRVTDNAQNLSAVFSSDGQYVTPTVSFDIDISPDVSDIGSTSPPYSLSVGILTAGNVVTAPGRVWLGIGSNSVGGASVYVRGAYSGLRSSLTTYTIPSSSSDLASSSQGYGLQVSSVGAGVTASIPYASAGDNVGLVDTSTRRILSSSGPITSSRSSVMVKAKVNALVPAANDYSDDLVFIIAASY